MMPQTAGRYGPSPALRTGQSGGMATLVVVHGAWGGGWEWSPVARLLRSGGHDVFTPTLTGMGERAHLGRHDRIGLDTHVRDIAAVLEFEDLHDVVLVGASYGGMPVTGAVDHAADRVNAVVYVDALVPRDGQSALDLLPPAFGEVVRAGLEEHGDAWRVPLPPDLFDRLVPVGSLPDDVRSAYRARLRDHPAAAFAEPLHLTGTVESVPRAFVRCTASGLAGGPEGDPIEASAVRARQEGWVYRELEAPHDPQTFDPTGIAAVLDDLSRQLGG